MKRRKRRRHRKTHRQTDGQTRKVCSKWICCCCCCCCYLTDNNFRPLGKQHQIDWQKQFTQIELNWKQLLQPVDWLPGCPVACSTDCQTARLGEWGQPWPRQMQQLPWNCVSCSTLRIEISLRFLRQFMLEKLVANMLAINAIKCNFNCHLNKEHDLNWAASVLALDWASSIEAKMIISIWNVNSFMIIYSLAQHKL